MLKALLVGVPRAARVSCAAGSPATLSKNPRRRPHRRGYPWLPNLPKYAPIYQRASGSACRSTMVATRSMARSARCGLGVAATCCVRCGPDHCRFAHALPRAKARRLRQACCLTLDRCIPAYRPVVMVVEHRGVRAEAAKIPVERCIAGWSRRECGIPQWLLCEDRCGGGVQAQRNRERHEFGRGAIVWQISFLFGAGQVAGHFPGLSRSGGSKRESRAATMRTSSVRSAALTGKTH